MPEEATIPSPTTPEDDAPSRDASPADSPPDTVLRPSLRDPWLFVVMGVALAFYTFQLASTALGGDNTQFIMMSQSPGIPHPPGYPLYMWLLQLARLVPSASAAWSAAFVTALIGALGAGCVMMAAQSWGASRSMATWVAAMFACSPLATHLATHAEVFALNVALSAAILACAGPWTWRWCHGTRRLVALGLLGGLALSHHHTAALIAPAGLFGVWLGVREADHLRQKIGGLFAAGVMLFGTMAALYGSLWALASSNHLPLWRWGDWTDLDGLWGHFIRREFGTLQLSSGAPNANPEPLKHVWLLLESMSIESLLMAPLLAIAAIVALGFGKRARIVVLLSVLLAGPAFTSMFNIPTYGWGVVVAERFYQLPLMVLWVFAAFGGDTLLKPIAARLPPERRHIILRMLAAVFVVGLGAQSLERTQTWHTPILEDYLVNTLKSVPPNAILIGTGDHRLFGFPYARTVLGQRPDVDYIDPSLLTRPWYRRRYNEKTGIKIEAFTHNKSLKRLNVNTLKVVESLAKTGRPILLTNLFTSRIIRNYPNYPRGICIAIHTDEESEPPGPRSIFEMNTKLFDEAFVIRDLDKPADAWARSVMGTYDTAWKSLANKFEEEGKPQWAARCRQKAGLYKPMALIEEGRRKKAEQRKKSKQTKKPKKPKNAPQRELDSDSNTGVIETRTIGNKERKVFKRPNARPNPKSKP